MNVCILQAVKGMVTRCTISLKRFVIATNLIINTVLKETRGPRIDSRICLHATRGFLDDLIVSTQSYVKLDDSTCT